MTMQMTHSQPSNDFCSVCFCTRAIKSRFRYFGCYKYHIGVKWYLVFFFFFLSLHSVIRLLQFILMSFYFGTIIIITLFESQIILAEHECCTNWRDCKSNKSNQIKCWFLRRGENRSTRRKTPWSRVESQQQSQPMYDAGSRNRTRNTLVEGERSHHCANPAPLLSSLKALCKKNNFGEIGRLNYYECFRYSLGWCIFIKILCFNEYSLPDYLVKISFPCLLILHV